MALNLGRRFFETVGEDGLGAALRATQRYLSTRSRRAIRRSRLRFLRMRSGGPTTIREVNGSEMELDLRPSSPHEIERNLALYGVQEPAATRLFRDVLNRLKERSDSTVHVFDVGANVGYFALLEAHVLGDRGNIYAVEAEPDNAGRLERNVERNDYSQIEIVQVAVGAERSTLELSIGGQSNLHRMAELRDESSSDETVTVDVYPLDELVEEKEVPPDEPVVVRMDIEGYEGHAFEGMTELLASDRLVYVFVEIHDNEYDPRDVVLDALEDHGFELEHVVSDGWDTVSSAETFDEVPETSNAHVMASRL